MSRVKIKKTCGAQTGYYGSKGRRMVTPASYDLYLDGDKVGEIWGYSQTRLSDGGSGHKGKAFGIALDHVGVRGVWREKMDAEIVELSEQQQER